MKRLILSFFLFIATVGLASAQGLFETAGKSPDNQSEKTVKLGGYVRGSAYGAGENYDFGTLFGETALQLNHKAKLLTMNTDLRFRSGNRFGGSFSEFEIKEAYAGISSKTVDVLLGEQIVSWGRTDGFNPTNNINPNNYFFLSGNPDDQKMSNFMLRSKVRITPMIEWEAIVIPIYRPSVYRYELFDLGASFVDPVLPEQKAGNGSLATRFNFELPGVGFSLSWFQGRDPFYGINLNSVDLSSGTPQVSYRPAFYRRTTFGLDFAVPLSSWIIRGEGAYNFTENEHARMYIPNCDLSYVMGVEYNFGSVTAILQYVGKHVLDFVDLNEPVLSDPMNPLALYQYANERVNYESFLINRKIFKQQFETNHALALTLSGDFVFSTLNAEMTGFYDFSTEEFLLRPKLVWNITDALALSAGYSYMKGPDKSMFSYAGPVLNGAFLEMKFSF
ncbi:MAG: hypothetical protein QM282_00040 [Bacteroidota bacterium]|jgi:hypothetical protein|nr:hypothetical protein [Bacteroidota bacterium]